MTGPVAPRDPEKARAYFYIMREKEICGLKQGDGKAVHRLSEISRIAEYLNCSVQ